MHLIRASKKESSLFSTCLHRGKDMENSWVPKGGVQPPDLNAKVSLALKVKDFCPLKTKAALTQIGQIVLLTPVLTRLI